MKSLIRPAAALLASFTFSVAAVPADVHGDLGKLVPEMIRLLEAKDYASVLEALIPPDIFKKITAEQPIAEFAKQFGETKGASLLAVLKVVKEKKPKLSEDGNTATFDLPENPEFPKKEIIFTKVEKRWFIKN
ncbi:MAG: hypothetical protein ABIP20_05490 [Chthoniobacteraceae bacterium]